MNSKLWAILAVILLVVGGFLLYPRESAPVSSTSSTNATPDDKNTIAGATITVHRSPTCGCCGEYEKYLAAKGFIVESIQTEELSALKQERGIPHDMQSCHTAFVAGYFVEGHIPVEAIQMLLEQKPDVDGIALPGMPLGSPGMGGTKQEPFKIYSIKDGVVAPFTEL